jgi:hypothetical protein
VEEPIIASAYAQPIPFPTAKVPTGAGTFMGANTTSSTGSSWYVDGNAMSTNLTATASNYSVGTYSEVEHALNVIKDKTKTKELEVEKVVKNTVIKIGGKEIKIHKVLDPECEACQ